MNAKQFLASKGIYSLDTKKRTNEVIQWMEEYAALKTNPKEPETVSSHEAEKEVFMRNCSVCKRETEQSISLYNPDIEDSGEVWVCSVCHEHTDWVST